MKNQKKLNELREEVLSVQSVHSQNYAGHVMNGVSEPVFEVVRKILTLEKKIEQLERDVNVVDSLRESLREEDMAEHQMSLVLEYRYIRHMEVWAVMRRMSVTRSTYWRRQRELLRLAEEYVRLAA